jgi:hypothetical protein
MNKETKELIILILVVLVFLVIYALSIDYEKTQCLASGGKWVSGMIGGDYSYFCVPK